MKRLILVLALLMGSVTVNAQLPEDATLTWTAPTKYENGTSLPPSEIAYYLAYCALSGQPASITNMGNVLTYRISDELPEDGDHACTVTTTGTNGKESGHSTVVNFTLDRRVPPDAPPSLVVN